MYKLTVEQVERMKRVLDESDFKEWKDELKSVVSYKESEEWKKLTKKLEKQEKKILKEIIEEAYKTWKRCDLVYSEHDKAVFQIKALNDFSKEVTNKHIKVLTDDKISNIDYYIVEKIMNEFGQSLDTPIFSELDIKRFELHMTRELLSQVDILIDQIMPSEEMEEEDVYE